MTKERAIEGLTRAANICPTTPLAEACRIAVTMLERYMESIEKKLGHNCYDCKHKDRMPDIYPCSYCAKDECNVQPSKWEPKEVDNGQND